ncbi:cob(I)yrinic acid a,c-diamide adenosyltransferase [Alloalcanivorax xenomutans]|jgi:cob(I)alamin adenosyltransferase|uniref:Corrinoid adenosyltransferase n=1 Tax=Alloalcanivorax xenomutans TaxID=1094342 RepID=A0A9Q3ZH17_9GAMM|nr:cob(I)yrinic acid a,c-diamide adenosyltransferase [Alloalcanivorax xenomutans]ERS14145.1 cob(I)alamin adenolsyltransferase/cobinamide ATP-dependent adenolsyltransferase [Alcanivorax sp. PN-3]KYZ85476.1 cob(I)yrinic acid a,c-diamide adenosyltransferase [Alcanivorax sp. KX64203]ARB47422.1 cob(I)yrinic acid a c-diamide adenosyltransferase [Alloalcanivorax xenomutans]MCE7508127.1 cob(I)yrinic acid a,c-diamide adenosyltransferase [Alloalcanivorax xenomutans]MCE7523378.1 cob(I)yrinic acid a,c-dia
MREDAKTPQRHAERMAKKQKIMQERIARARNSQGVLLVLTGPGKGKSSSAFGMAARALGHDMKVGVVQFIKGAFKTGEERFFRAQPLVDYHVMGEGYTWDTQDRERDVAAAEAAWAEARRMLRDPDYKLVVLDELNIALRYEYLDLDAVLDDLQDRPEMQHVVVTGRYAPKPLIELADTVTEMKVVKHAFKDLGVKAQKGIEL